jgi:hypothetical protein
VAAKRAHYTNHYTVLARLASRVQTFVGVVIRFISAYPLLSAYCRSVYRYKRMRLLTRVYGIATLLCMCVSVLLLSQYFSHLSAYTHTHIAGRKHSHLQYLLRNTYDIVMCLLPTRHNMYIFVDV